MHSLKNDIVLNCVDEAHVFSVKVVGVTTGQLVNWKEDKNTGLLTVRSQDLLYINEINENTHNLIRVKIGVKLSDMIRKTFQLDSPQLWLRDLQ